MAQTRKTVAALRTQIDRASHFTNDLLAYGRPQPLEPRTVDVGALAQLAASNAQQGFDTAVTATVEVTVEDELTVEADQHQLLQALLALLDNALLAVADRAGGRIKVTVQRRDDGAQIIVEDNGPGIPDALCTTLFEPFVTGRPRAGPRPGTGLGLSIVRRIAERHGGSVIADRSPLTGARFTMTLPSRPPALGPMQPGGPP